MGRATSDPADRRAVLERIAAEEVDFVLLWFTDIVGQLKSFAVTIAELEGALDDGMGFDGSSITGFNSIEESDMVAIPDPRTFQVLPWRTGEYKVARMICDVVTPDGEPYEGDPRYVLRRALERMTAMGFDTFNVGPELEYFYFKSDEATEILDHGGYFDLATLDVAGEWRKETIKALESMGIPVEYAHHEVAPSQHEIDMRYSEALGMADHTVTYRLIVKEIATKYGIYATFMPKPLFGENGSGMHTHQSLFTNGKNAFYDPDDVVAPVARRQGLHRRPAPSRPRDLRDLRAVGQLLQAAGAGLRGAGVRRLVTAQPLGADPDPPVPPRQGAGDAGGDPLPRSVVQPVPDLRRAAAGRARGHRARLRAPGADGGEPLRAHPGGARGTRHRQPAREPRRGRHGARPLGPVPADPRARTSSSASSL